MQCAQHRDRGNGGASKLGRDILRDAGKAQNIDVQHLAGALHRFEIVAAVVSQSEVQTFPGRRLPYDVGMTFELIPDRRTDEIGTVRVEPFLNHQIDVTKIDKAKIDRDFFCFGRLGSKFPYIAHRKAPSNNHLVGRYMDVFWTHSRVRPTWRAATKTTARRSGPSVPL